MITLTKAFKVLWIGMALAVGLNGLSVNERVILVAENYIGVEETAGANRHPEIDKWNTRLGLPLGSSYCAAFVSFVLDSAEVKTPAIRTGVAQQFITKQSISATKVSAGTVTIPAGSLVIWKRGNTWQGHVGITVADWKGPTGYTIEANTSPSDAGSQSNGDGVYRKIRRIDPTAYLRITHFTIVE
jgi:hypothetical protein